MLDDIAWLVRVAALGCAILHSWTGFVCQLALLLVLAAVRRG